MENKESHVEEEIVLAAIVIYYGLLLTAAVLTMEVLDRLKTVRDKALKLISYD